MIEVPLMPKQWYWVLPPAVQFYTGNTIRTSLSIDRSKCRVKKEIEEWLNENCGEGNWELLYGDDIATCVRFNNSDHAVLFKLTWSGQ